MKLKIYLLLSVFSLFACNALPIETQSGDITITVIPGAEWLHRFSFLTKNTPQFAIWTEDESGGYIDTLFVTRKTATEGWIFNNGNRRIESLPVWAHQRNVVEDDGLLLPTKEDPLTDGITGATPKDRMNLVIRPNDATTPFYVVLEINHSTDFNDYWTKSAEPGTPEYSGGTYGSGQPSLVYKALIDPTEEGPWELALAGHGSPDGSSGNITTDTSSITTALHIIETILVERK